MISLILAYPTHRPCDRVPNGSCFGCRWRHEMPEQLVRVPLWPPLCQVDSAQRRWPLGMPYHLVLALPRGVVGFILELGRFQSSVEFCTVRP